MADNASQDNRVGRLATPLGKDVLLLGSFEAVEGLGELFEIRVQALSARSDIDFNALLGRNASIHLDTADGGGRDFSGVLTEARWLGDRTRYSAYSLVLRPWLWVLSLTSDCRIFSNKNPRDIIKQVFKDRGFSDVDDRTSRSYPTLEYCVQYRETDLSFVLRLMEQYGIYYYFEFDKGDGSSPSGHQLVLADSASYDKLPGLRALLYRPSTQGDWRDEQQVNAWTKSRSMVTGVFTLNDYNYEKPNAQMVATAQQPYLFTHGGMELYDHPGDYLDQDQGRTLAQVDRDTERTRQARCSASGAAPSLTPGYAVSRSSPTPVDGEDGDYLILRCRHAFGPQSYETNSEAEVVNYAGSYDLAKSDLPFRMPMRTRRPVIVGTQSALVVGEKGEEIDVDKQGRICVQFYWDRKSTASRRVRVAQFWAGHGRGAKFLPRVGDEVLVHYEEGDPDRPIVVGSVYNGANPIPSDMPAKKNVSGVLTKSTKNSDGYHMLTFDDTAGKEVVKLRSQRDLMVKALRNETRQINGSQSETVGGDITQSVGGDMSVSVGSTNPPGGGNYTLEATQQIVLKVKSSSITITPEGITIQAPMIYLNP